MRRLLPVATVLCASIAFAIGLVTGATGCDGCWGVTTVAYTLASGTYVLDGAPADLSEFDDLSLAVDAAAGLVTIDYRDAADVAWQVVYERQSSRSEERY